MEGKNRVYIPIVLNADTAKRELDYARDFEGSSAWSVVARVRQLLLDANLTPLQAQAVLVRAWAQVQTKGRISPDTEAE